MIKLEYKPSDIYLTAEIFKLQMWIVSHKESKSDENTNMLDSKLVKKNPILQFEMNKIMVKISCHKNLNNKID